MAVVYGASAEPAGMGFATVQSWRAIKRHKRLFFACGVSIFVLGALVVAKLPASYRSSATVEIATEGVDPLAPVGAEQADQFQDDDLPTTVAAMMQSRDVAQAVLTEIPPPPPRPKPQLLRKFCAWTQNIVCAAAPPADPLFRQQAAIDNFLKNLAVTPEAHSRILDVDVTAGDAGSAQALANAVVENYQRISVVQQAAQSDHAAGWLQARTQELQQRWLTAVQAAERYRSANNLTDTDAGGAEMPLIDQQLADAAASLEAAQTQLIVAQARHRAGDDAGRAEPESPAAIANAATLEQLETARDQMAGEFGPNYPKVNALTHQIAALRRHLGDAGDGAIPGDGAVSVAAAEAQVDQLTARLNTLSQEAVAQGAVQAEYQILNAEADNAHRAYSTFVEHAAEVSDRGALLEPAVTVVSQASLPLRPSFPDRPKLLLGILFLSLVAGAAAALARQNLAGGFAEGGLSQSAGLPLLAALPYVQARQGRQVARHILDDPHSRASDAMRGIAQSLSLLAVAQGRAVLVTSPGAGEGRSIFAAWLASTINLNSGSALVISTGQQMGMLTPQNPAPMQLGFTDMLFGNAKAEDVVRRDPITEVDMISAGSLCPRPMQRDDLLRLRGILLNFQHAYSVVILDSAPLLAAQDGFMLSELTDDVIFLCRWQHTSPSAVTASIDRLRAHGANVAGIVVSMMNRNPQLATDGRNRSREMALTTRLYGA